MGEKGSLPGYRGEELGAEGEGETGPAPAGLPCRTKQESSFRQEQSFAIGKACSDMFLDSLLQQQ